MTIGAAIRPQAQHLPAPRTAVLGAAALVACAWWTLGIAAGPFAQYWWNDFQYFWMAAVLFLEGTSPYSDAYLERGGAMAASFHAPFFYPPAILPLFAGFGALPFAKAAAAFFVINVCLIAVTSAMIGRIAARLRPGTDPLLAAAAAAMILIIGVRGVMTAAAIGQTSIIFMTATVAGLFGVLFGKRTLIAIAACVLLMKPHFGLSLLAILLANRASRTPALAGVAAYGALTIFAGLTTGSVLDAITGFIANAGTYTDNPLNERLYSAGLTHLLARAGVELGPFALAALLFSGPLLLAPWRNDRDAVQAFALASLWPLIIAPTHPTDFALTACAIACLLSARSRVAALAIMAGLALLARGSHFGKMFGSAGEEALLLNTQIHTAGLALLAGGLARISRWRRAPALGMRSIPSRVSKGLHT